MSKIKTVDELMDEPVKPVFTDKELEQMRELGIELSQEDLELFTEAEAIADTTEFLPENEDKFFEQLDKKLPNTENFSEGYEAFTNLAIKNDPFYSQSLALYEVLQYLVEEIPPEVVKLDQSAIEEQKAQEVIGQLSTILEGIE